MSHSWTHPWCKSPCRDEAVRAAEDDRPGPLPTLEEAIAAVTERRPPEPGGGGNVTGLRTERVTPLAPESRPAETRQTQRTKAKKIGVWQWFPPSDRPAPPPPPAPPQVHRGSGVFDANGDEVPWEGVVAALKAERDAAIRERDAAKSDAEKSAVRIKSQAENVAYFRRDRDETVSERDSAIRERDTLQGEITSVLDRSEFASTELTRLRNRVAELESQLESVADRAAAAETALESAAKLAPAPNADGGSNHAAPAASGAAGTEAAVTELPTD